MTHSTNGTTNITTTEVVPMQAAPEIQQAKNTIHELTAQLDHEQGQYEQARDKYWTWKAEKRFSPERRDFEIQESGRALGDAELAAERAASTVEAATRALLSSLETMTPTPTLEELARVDASQQSLIRRWVEVLDGDSILARVQAEVDTHNRPVLGVFALEIGAALAVEQDHQRRHQLEEALAVATRAQLGPELPGLVTALQELRLRASQVQQAAGWKALNARYGIEGDGGNR